MQLVHRKEHTMGNILSTVVFQPPDSAYENFETFTAYDGAQICYSVTEPPSARESLGTLLYFHGNGENLIDVQSTVKMLSRQFKRTVFAMDYRNYDKSKSERSKKPPLTERVFKRDIESFVHHVNMKDNVIVFGRSLGSSAAIHACACIQQMKNPPQIEALIIQSGFFSAGRTVLSCIPSIVDIFKNYEDVRYLNPDIPKVLLVHGGKDQVVPPTHAFYMEDAFKTQGFPFVKRKMIPSCDHNNILPGTVHAFYERMSTTSS